MKEKRILKIMLKHKWWMIIHLIGSIGTAAFGAYLSIIVRDITNVAVALDLSGFWELMIMTAIFMVMYAFTHYLKEIFYAIFVRRVIKQLREEVYTGVMNRDMAEFESVNSGDYISALTNDIQLFQGQYLIGIKYVWDMITVIIFGVAVMLYLSWIITVALLVSSFALMAIQAVFGKPILKRTTKVSETLASFTIRLKDFFTGFEVIKSYQMQKQSDEMFKKENDDVVNADFSLYNIHTLAGSLAMVVGFFLNVGVVFFSAYLIIVGVVDVGVMAAILIASGSVTGPISGLGHLIPMIKGTQEVRERLESLMATADMNEGTTVATFNRDIRVENISYTYANSDQAAISGVSHTFEKNKKYVLIGKSGCGKTTLAKAVVGHFNELDGKIAYDSIDTKELSRESVYKIPAMVHQDVYMFDADIESNIGLFKDYDAKVLNGAISASGVDLFLNEERTLKSAVGEDGANLSGGQKQRIAVARALIQNKPLLVLDEGTSAIDKQTGNDIEKRLLERDDLTLITITHSLDERMLRKYDEIIYMENGKIIASGHYDELAKANGKFIDYLSS